MTAALRRPAVQGTIVVIGCWLLVARPWFWADGPSAWIVVAFFTFVGFVGLAWPTDVGVFGPDRLRRAAPATAAPATAAPATAAPTTAAPATAAPTRAAWVTAAWTTAAGAGMFGLARLLAAGMRPLGHDTVTVGLAVLAAVAEEAFFRRFVYQFLLRSGARVAVLGSAGAFALVHVAIYGPRLLPLDLAAGLVLSAQRWYSGTWISPAITHAWANLLAIY